MSARTKTPEDVLAFIRAVAHHQGWTINPDERFVSDLVEGLATNYNRYGYFLCPCRDGDGERSEDSDIICPCAYVRADQKAYGHCFCGLFLSQEFAQRGQAPRPIPERRGSAD